MNVNTVICLTGMHRSGTSLTAAWLEICGLSIHDGDYWGPGPGNPKGHFEDKEFVSFHESVILQTYADSMGWKIYRTNPLQFFDKKLILRARKLVSKRNSKYQVWGWKDPRSVFFLNEWKKILPDLKLILIWRPSLEVVRSLKKRSKLTNEKIMEIGFFDSLRLWKIYNKMIYDFKVNHQKDALLFPLDAIINNDREVLGLINRNFSLNLEYLPINRLYQPDLLSRNRSSFINHIMCKLAGNMILEKQLKQKSELQ